MLTKGFKDEQQRKISEVLGKILQIDFLPDYWEKQQRQELNAQLTELTGLSLDAIITQKTETFLQHLHNQEFSFENYELLADVLWNILPLEPKEKEKTIAEKIVAIYQHAQQESKMFSFGLIQKINNAKALL